MMNYSENYVNGILNFLNNLPKEDYPKFFNIVGEHVESIGKKWNMEYSKFPFEYMECYIGITYSCGCKTGYSVYPTLSQLNKGHWTIKTNLGHHILVYLIEYDHECENCMSVTEMKHIFHPDSLLQNSIYSHGLTTGFAGNKSEKDIIDNIAAFTNIVNNKSEICCSWKSQPIGGIGLYVKGEVTLASNCDLWSALNPTGHRVFDTNDWDKLDELIASKEELRIDAYDHTEFFIIPERIIGLWVKDWFYNSHRDFVNKLKSALAKISGGECRFYVVGNRRR